METNMSDTDIRNAISADAEALVGGQTPGPAAIPQPAQPAQTTAPAPAAIRNIMQSVGEREIIKTAPDIMVYLAGRPYIINPYINSNDAAHQSDGSYTVVNFNDFIDSFTASYQTDMTIPSGSFSLSVPNSLKYLFQAPGGNNIIEPMTPVQVFAKGYFPSPTGNTLYYRVFKGLTTNVSHADTGTSLQISVNLQGTLRFLDLMYIDLQPALLTNSHQGVVVFTSNQYQMNPYMAIADTVLRAVSPAGFQVVAIQQALLASQGQKLKGVEYNRESDWSGAVQAGFVNKWQAILTNLAKDVRILGYNAQDALDLKKQYKTVKDANKARLDRVTHGETAFKDPEKEANDTTRPPDKSPRDQVLDKNWYIGIIRRYFPDFQVGNVSLLGGKVVSRLERLRTLVNLIGYEGYQDLDGAIIFKPPFYNLDVTNLDAAWKPTVPPISASSYIREEANPFVVHLSEIETESETEDEGGIKVTRMLVQPDWLATFHGIGNPELLPVAEHIDIAKLAKFGLREAPAARQLAFMGAGDKIEMYAYAVSELVRANQGYRTYTFTIPLRPELRLGFPMYIKHKDMYGYIKNISISYQQAGSATMSITLDTIRKRILVSQADSNKDGSTNTRYISQNNLVMEWTEPPSSSKPKLAPYLIGPPPPGTAATLRTPADTPFNAQEWEYVMHQKEKLGTLWATRPDTPSKSFRIQNDVAKPGDAMMTTEMVDGEEVSVSTGIEVDGKKQFFSKENWSNGINMVYYKKILTCQPYTDEKGYELITPFPWGRWQDVNAAIQDSRHSEAMPSEKEDEMVNPDDVQQAGSVAAMNVFLFAGLTSPTGSSGVGGGAMSDALNAKLQITSNGKPVEGYDSVEMDSVIELQTPKPGDVIDDPSLKNSVQPDITSGEQPTDFQNLRDRLGMFIVGAASLSSNTQSVKGLPAPASPQQTPKPSFPKLLNPFKGSNK